MNEAAPETVVWNLLRGALTTRALGLVAELRVADALADGPRPVEEVALEVGADPDTLRRLLRALASDGVFAESAPGNFRNTDVSEVLRRDGWDDFAHLFARPFLAAVAALEADGDSSFERAFGAEYWSWLAAHPDERAAFDRAMAQGWRGRLERLERVEWRDGETVVDVGGGDGSLLRALLRRRPGLRGVVFDLPETVRDERHFGERLRFVEGSFFDGVPPGDVHVLSTILHDWDDERAAAILRSIRRASGERGHLVVLDAILGGGNAPDGAKWLDLLMLALAGGRERTEPEWRELLGATGWEPIRIDGGLIEARCR